MDLGLTDRVVMVTGASGGIGGDVVRTFAQREGARVIAHYRGNRLQAETLAKEIGPRCLPLGADLTNEEEVVRLFRETETQLGPVEILVADAGFWPAKDAPLPEMTLDQWNGTLMANLTSVFLCAREFLRGISRHGITEPAAVLIGSTAGVFGEAGHADYAAAKAGLTYGLARTLKNEICRLAPRGRVNVVCPGWTQTHMTQRFADDPGRIRRALQTMALRKIARPTDVAGAVVYLASARLAGHVSGQVLMVSGGMEGRLLYAEPEIDLTTA